MTQSCHNPLTLSLPFSQYGVAIAIERQKVALQVVNKPSNPEAQITLGEHILQVNI